jgi:pantoate--beta-alanine ligase
MEIIKEVIAIKQYIKGLTSKTVSKTGFVPTMGALHNGHISLLEKCKKDGNYSIVSIFVNPNQFNNKDDYSRYPRVLEKDIQLLEKAGCDLLFLPDETQMYPEVDNRVFDFGKLDKVLEGYYRPGHFNGVAQIVSKLFDVINPDFAYFGEKDFQQLAVIKLLVEQMNSKIYIVSCPTIREQNGLAMSSRNMLLSNEQRENAAIIYETLTLAKSFQNEKTVGETRKMVIDRINETGFFKVEYFEVMNADTFEYINNWSEKNKKVGCIAVYAGNVRLIDNIRFN